MRETASPRDGSLIRGSCPSATDPARSGAPLLLAFGDTVGDDQSSLPSLAAVLRKNTEIKKRTNIQRYNGLKVGVSQISACSCSVQVQLVQSANVEHVQRVRYKRCKRNPSRYRQISICVGKFLGNFFALRAQANFESNLEKS